MDHIKRIINRIQDVIYGRPGIFQNNKISRLYIKYLEALTGNILPHLSFGNLLNRDIRKLIASRHFSAEFVEFIQEKKNIKAKLVDLEISWLCATMPMDGLKMPLIAEHPIKDFYSPDVLNARPKLKPLIEDCILLGNYRLFWFIIGMFDFHFDPHIVELLIKYRRYKILDSIISRTKVQNNLPVQCVSLELILQRANAKKYIPTKLSYTSQTHRLFNFVVNTIWNAREFEKLFSHKVIKFGPPPMTAYIPDFSFDGYSWRISDLDTFKNVIKCIDCTGMLAVGFKERVERFHYREYIQEVSKHMKYYGPTTPEYRWLCKELKNFILLEDKFSNEYIKYYTAFIKKYPSE